MAVAVRIPTILRTYTAGEAEVSVEPSEQTLSGTISALEAAYPGLAARVLDDEGALRRFVNIYVNDEDVRFEGGLETPTPAGAQISIIPAVAGG
ncbi:MAG TPA: ubiquitin-like small modifier protein 1 [Candidatus Nanopelagicales bacterium]